MSIKEIVKKTVYKVSFLHCMYQTVNNLKYSIGGGYFNC